MNFNNAIAEPLIIDWRVLLFAKALMPVIYILNQITIT